MKKFNLSKDDVNVVDVNKRSPLHWACAHGNTDQAKIISKLGADVGIIDVEGKTPAHWAASSKCRDPGKMISVLVGIKTRGAGSALCWQDYEGRQALHVATMSHNTDMVQTISAQSSCIINATDHRSRSSLHWAAVQGHQDTVTVLLAAGAKVDLLDEVGATAVHLGVQSGDSDTVTLFIRAGHHSVLDNHLRTPLMWSVALNRVELVQLFTDTSTLDLKDKFGYSALHIAVTNNVIESLSMLLKLGADINIKNDEGETPLILAAKNGNVDIVNELIENKADTRVVDNNRKTALHSAASSGQASIVKMLMKTGVDIDTEDVSGRTSLMIACHGGNASIVTDLIDAGADIDHQDRDGMCCLHWAVRKNHVDIVKILLDHGVYTNNVGRIRDDGDIVQLTPLDSAVMEENSDIVRMLQEKHVGRKYFIYKLEIMGISFRLSRFPEFIILPQQEYRPTIEDTKYETHTPRK